MAGLGTCGVDRDQHGTLDAAVRGRPGDVRGHHINSPPQVYIRDRPGDLLCISLCRDTLLLLAVRVRLRVRVRTFVIVTILGFGLGSGIDNNLGLGLG